MTATIGNLGTFDVKAERFSDNMLVDLKAT